MCFLQGSYLLGSIAVCVGLPILHLVVLDTIHCLHLAVWVDLGQCPANVVIVRNSQGMLNQICFCFRKGFVTGIQIIVDGICLLNQRAEFLVGIQQSFVVLVFFQVIDVGQGSGVVCTVVAIGLLTDVVKRIAVVCIPAGDVDRLKLRLIDLFGCTGDIGLDIQLYKRACAKTFALSRAAWLEPEM